MRCAIKKFRQNFEKFHLISGITLFEFNQIELNSNHSIFDLRKPGNVENWSSCSKACEFVPLDMEYLG